MVSSNVTRAGHGSRVVVSLNSTEGKRSGLRTDSVIMTDNLATILHAEIDRAIGSLAGWNVVDEALRHTLDSKDRGTAMAKNEFETQPF